MAMSRRLPIVMAFLILATVLIAPTSASAGGLDHGTDFRCQDVPCLDELPTWDSSRNAVTIPVHFDEGFDVLNIVLVDNWGNRYPQIDDVVPYGNGYQYLASVDALPYRTYSIWVQACRKPIWWWQTSDCTDWSLPTTVSTVPSQNPVTTFPLTMRFAHSDKCLDDPQLSRADGTWLDQWNCIGTTNEMWLLDYFDAKNFRIRNVFSDKCVAVEDGNYQRGSRIIQSTCGKNLNQYFRATKDFANNVPFGDYQWFSPSAVDNDDLVLNVRFGHTTNGGKLILWDRGAYPNEYIRVSENHECRYDSPIC